MGSYFSTESSTVSKGASSSSPPPRTAISESEKLRESAHQAREEAKTFSKSSQEAFHQGNHQKAKEFSLKSKELHARADELNHQAAELVFKAKNGKMAGDAIDLHGLTVTEALEYVEKRIVEEKARGSDHLVVIVGAGKHSIDGIAKIKPAVETILKKHQLNFEMNKPNEGCIYVRFDGYNEGWWQQLTSWFGSCVIS